MGKENDHLFLLIKSLTKNEKGYFKRFSTSHSKEGKNNYIRLFEVIEKQQEYDEEALKKVFNKEKFITHLSSEKNYLYSLILKSLTAYHSEISTDAKLKDMLRQVEILYTKALYNQCSKLLRKIKQLAYDYEKHLILMDVLTWERTIELTQIKSATFLEKLIHDNRIETDLVINSLKTISTYSKMNLEIFLLHLKKGSLRSKAQLHTLEKMMDKELLVKDNILVFEAQCSFYNSHFLFYAIQGNHSKAYPFSKKYIETIEAHPKQIEEQPIIYIKALNNHALVCKDLLNYKEQIHALEKMRNLVQMPIGTNEKIKIFEMSYPIEIGTYLDTGQFEKGLLLVPELEEGLKLYKGKMNKVFEIIITYQIAYTYFGTGNYKLALKWLRKVLDYPFIELRDDLYGYFTIFYLIIHFELGDTDSMESVVKSTYRFLHKKERLFKFETIFMNSIKKLPAIDQKEKVLDLFKALKSELLKLSDDPYETKAMGYPILLCWLESKIEKRNFAEIIRENPHSGVL